MGNSLAIQWLGFCASTGGGTDLTSGWRTKILKAVWHGKKKKKLICKGKHTVKAHQPHIKLVGKLKGKSSKSFLSIVSS